MRHTDLRWIELIRYQLTIIETRLLCIDVEPNIARSKRPNLNRGSTT